MKHKNNVPKRNVPKWAQRIINLLETQNSRLEDISNQANEIAKASNEISNRSIFIAIAAIAVSIGVSVFAYFQLEKQFSLSVDVQKKSVLLQEIVARQNSVMAELIQVQSLIETSLDLCQVFPARTLENFRNVEERSYKEADAVFAQIINLMVQRANIARILHNTSSTSSLFPHAYFVLIRRPYSHKYEDPAIPYTLNRSLYEDALAMFKEEIGQALELPAFSNWKQWYLDKINKPPSNLFSKGEEVYIEDTPRKYFDDYFYDINNYRYYTGHLYDAMKSPISYVFEKEAYGYDYERHFNWSLALLRRDDESEKLFTNDRPCSLAAREHRYDFLRETGFFYRDDEEKRDISTPSFEEWSSMHKKNVNERYQKIIKRIEAEEAQLPPSKIDVLLRSR